MDDITLVFGGKSNIRSTGIGENKQLSNLTFWWSMVRGLWSLFQYVPNKIVVLVKLRKIVVPATDYPDEYNLSRIQFL